MLNILFIVRWTLCGVTALHRQRAKFLAKGEFMELQLLKNVPAYKRRYWTFPALAIDRQINASHRWIAFLLLFGKTAIGVRIYYAFAKNTEQANQPDSGE